MEVKLLNKDLGKEFIPVLFCCSPIAIPINDDGRTVPEDEATDVHYSTVVWNNKSKDFSILEFDKKTKRALAQYRKRHSRLEDLEILIFRDPEDNRFRMTLGNTAKSGLPFGDEQIKKAAAMSSMLSMEYLSNHGYKVSDRGNK